MQLRPVGIRVIHRIHFRLVFPRLRLRTLPINAGRSGHVEPLFAFHRLGIMHQHKMRISLALRRHSCGAVRLIANNQIKFRQTLLLSIGNGFQRLIGGKNHR